MRVRSLQVVNEQLEENFNVARTSAAVFGCIQNMIVCETVLVTPEFCEERCGLYGQAEKRTRWMPWQLEAMKDVVACEKAGRGGKQPSTPACPNGETHGTCAVS